ncbi:MAG: hypothetical protein V1738_03385 [Patescibacteria group bacterium]
METIVASFISGFVSWNALAWVMIGIASLSLVRLTIRHIGQIGVEISVALHGTAGLLAIMTLFIDWVLGPDLTATDYFSWLNWLIDQFTVQSLVINLMTAILLLSLIPNNSSTDAKK